MIISVEDFLKLDIKDEVFIIETDTVYGIGCLYCSSVGAQRINEIKDRASNKFYSILVSNFDQVNMLTNNAFENKDLMDKYWPGALTLIMNKSNLVKEFVSNSDTVGLRMPDSKKCLSVLDKFGPMIMTSLNKSGEPPITKFNDTLRFEDMVDYVVKGEDLSGVPSTVYDTINKKVLRSGEIKINF